MIASKSSNINTKPLFILAPMDDVTDTVFRQVISACGKPDLCFSEFVNVDGLMSAGRKSLQRKLERFETEPPLVAHIWGLNPANFKKAARQLASGSLAQEIGLSTNYAGIDLNMGCPVRAVTKIGACSGLIKNRALAAEIIAAVKDGNRGRLPVSAKTRLGFGEIDPSWTEFILKQGVDMLSIHLRTVKEMSKVPAHFEELIRIKHQRDQFSPNTLLIANGDIGNIQQGQEIIKRYNIDGVMIGRGIFTDPFAFSSKIQWDDVGTSGRIGLFRKHLVLYKAWAENPDKGVKRLNKYAKIYLSGFDGAKQLREKLALVSKLDDMLTELDSFATGLPVM